LIINFCF